MICYQKDNFYFKIDNIFISGHYEINLLSANDKLSWKSNLFMDLDTEVGI